MCFQGHSSPAINLFFNTYLKWLKIPFHMKWEVQCAPPQPFCDFPEVFMLQDMVF